MIEEFKLRQLEDVARHRESLRQNPHLRWLFFEITDRCNLRCKHCGSSCTAEGNMLSTEDIETTLRQLDSRRTVICLTGGEPMLHPDFFGIAELVHSMGFRWGMTTNATLIDSSAAARLKECGMGSVSVSLDGLEASHDALRQRRGAFRLAVSGIEALMSAGLKPQVTSVFHKGNIDELEPMYSFLSDMGITSWRPINVEPIGRACETGELLLSPEEYARLISFIRTKRFDRECKMEITFGCSHFLGAMQERMVRDHYFLCGAGILIASIRSNGDICACLDIEARDELTQGNIRRDSFIEVWEKGFGAFRQDRTAASALCRECPQRFICGGDAAHTWDYDRAEPMLCYKHYGDALDRLCGADLPADD